jgi:aldose 1-epimerase
LASYEAAWRYHGAIIGPVANRISGALAVIDGQTHRFEANQDNQITLHSGAAGTHSKIWSLGAASDTSATLTIVLPDGEGGFPGLRQITAQFDLSATALRLTLTATTDRPTLMNLANHSYWNLDGTPTWSGHRLQIAASSYLPTTDFITPTGQIASVTDTPFDFQDLRPAIPGRPPLDTNFCVSSRRTALREVLWLQGQSGPRLTLATTEPGVQIYDARPDYPALAIEAQFWPDAPNNPSFPPIILLPSDTWQQITEWRFATS